MIITNESEQDAYIPTLSVIAELETYHCILPKHHVTDLPATQSSPTFNVIFGNSPIPSEWKERVNKKLGAISEIFSNHDLDFGCTNQVMMRHHL